MYVPLPTPDDRYSILKAISANVNLAPDVDLKKIGYSARAEGYSGADCAALLREAGLAVLKESNTSLSTTVPVESTSSAPPVESRELCITESHFQYAFDNVIPSVSRKDQARYDRMRRRMAHARSRGAVGSEPNEEEDGTVEGTAKKMEANTPIKSEDKDGDTAMEPN